MLKSNFTITIKSKRRLIKKKAGETKQHSFCNIVYFLRCIVPITDLWREELRQLTEKAGMGLPKEIKEQQEVQPRRTSVYSAETGRLLPPPSRAMSRGFSRQKQRPRDLFQHIVPEMDQEALVSSRVF